MLEIVVEDHRVRVGPRFSVSFQRTLRIPDDGRTFPLPPGLGIFPVRRVADHADRLPAGVFDRRDLFIPMYQREALWLGLHGAAWKPNAVKIGAGGINVLTGEPFDLALRGTSQDYVVVPPQPWIDGVKTGRDVVRQFVAMPLGLGYSLEASIEAEERRGAIQLAVFNPRPGRFPDAPPPETEGGPRRQASAGRMGLGAGGVMRQKVYPDRHGSDAWDPEARAALTVHILNSLQYREVTGEAPPPTPIDAAAYTKHGLPWFDLYDEERGDIGPSGALAAAKTVAERDAERGIAGEAAVTVEIDESRIHKIQMEDPAGGVRSRAAVRPTAGGARRNKAGKT